MLTVAKVGAYATWVGEDASVGREDLDLVEVLTAVVQPCVARLVWAGELEHLTLGHKQQRVPVLVEQSPARGISVAHPGQVQVRVETRPVLSMTLKGEIFEFVFWPTASIDPYPREELENQREALFDSLQDFIAQSRFGWGQLRD